MSRALALGVAFLCLGGAMAAVPGSAADGPAPTVQTPDGFATAEFRVAVHGNGSATWTFEYSQPLGNNETKREQFRAYADRFNAEETELWVTFRNRSERLTAAGRNATGRDMTARNFRREATVSELGTRGIVRMSFLWTDFARAEGDRIIVDDVFGDGLYIGTDQWLVLEAGSGVAFAQVDPEPDDTSGKTVAGSDAITWFGQRQFTDNHPRVELLPAGGATTGTATQPRNPPGTDSPAGTTTATQAGGGDDMSMPLVALFVLVVGLGVVAAWRSGALGSTVDDGPDAGPVGSPESAASTGDVAAGAEPAVHDEELLTDEDRVIRLLKDHGSRMKQADIVEETDWSKSKVSMLLSDMEDDEQISKLRVGRENIVSLAGHEPDAAGSPFDDEE